MFWKKPTHYGKDRFKMKGGRPRQVKSPLFPRYTVDATKNGNLCGGRPWGYKHGPKRPTSDILANQKDRTSRKKKRQKTAALIRALNQAEAIH